MAPLRPDVACGLQHACAPPRLGLAVRPSHALACASWRRHRRLCPRPRLLSQRLPLHRLARRRHLRSSPGPARPFWLGPARVLHWAPARAAWFRLRLTLAFPALCVPASVPLPLGASVARPARPAAAGPCSSWSTQQANGFPFPFTISSLILSMCKCVLRFNH